MSTSTTRLGLVKPAGSEDYDVGVINANSDKIDGAAGVTPATSTTRPSAPFDGQAVHESDTAELVVRRSGVWSSLGTTAATASRIARRGATGTLKVATAVATDEAVTKGQMDTAIAGSWTAITLSAPWTVYTGAAAPGSAGAGPYAPTFAYRQEGNRVFLRGWILSSSAVSAVTAFHTTAVPVGLRPATAIPLWPVTDGSDVPKRCEIFTDGKIYTNRALASGTYLDFSSVSWYI